MHIFGEHHGIGKGCSILLLSIFISYLLKPFVSLDFVGCHRDFNFFLEVFCRHPNGSPQTQRERERVIEDFG